MQDAIRFTLACSDSPIGKSFPDKKKLNAEFYAGTAEVVSIQKPTDLVRILDTLSNDFHRVLILGIPKNEQITNRLTTKDKAKTGFSIARSNDDFYQPELSLACFDYDAGEEDFYSVWRNLCGLMPDLANCWAVVTQSSSAAIYDPSGTIAKTPHKYHFYIGVRGDQKTLKNQLIARAWEQGFGFFLIAKNASKRERNKLFDAAVLAEPNRLIFESGTLLTDPGFTQKRMKPAIINPQGGVLNVQSNLPLDYVKVAESKAAESQRVKPQLVQQRETNIKTDAATIKAEKGCSDSEAFYIAKNKQKLRETGILPRDHVLFGKDESFTVGQLMNGYRPTSRMVRSPFGDDDWPSFDAYLNFDDGGAFSNIFCNWLGTTYYPEKRKLLSGCMDVFKIQPEVTKESGLNALSAAIEGFFNQPQPNALTLIKSTTGAGKTETIRKVIPTLKDKRVLFVAPTAANLRAFADGMDAVSVHISPATDTSLCSYIKELNAGASELIEWDSKICGSKENMCPHFEKCEYYNARESKQHAAVTHQGFLNGVHALSTDKEEYDLFVIDESILESQAFTRGVSFARVKDAILYRMENSFENNQIVKAKLEVGLDVIKLLFEYQPSNSDPDAEREAFCKAINELRKNADYRKRLACAQEHIEKTDVSFSKVPSRRNISAYRKWLLDQRKRPYWPTGFFNALIEAIESPYAPANPPFSFAGEFILYHGFNAVLTDKPVLLLDATANKELTPLGFPNHKTTFIELNIQQDRKVIQAFDSNLSRTKVNGAADFYVDKLNQLSADSRVGVVGYKSITEQLDKDALHFYGNRGRNDLADKEVLLLAGMPRINDKAVKDLSLSLYGDREERRAPLDFSQSRLKVAYPLKKGNPAGYGQASFVYNDARVMGVSDYLVYGELLQALGRLRAIHASETRYLIAMDKTPLPVLVDDLIKGEDLTPAFIAGLLDGGAIVPKEYQILAEYLKRQDVTSVPLNRQTLKDAGLSQPVANSLLQCLNVELLSTAANVAVSVQQLERKKRVLSW